MEIFLSARFLIHTPTLLTILLLTNISLPSYVLHSAGARVLQVLRLGAPVTSLSFSPTQDLLATSHVEHAGVYLWANQLVFGSGADVVPSDKPINARLPTLRSGFHRSSSNGGDGLGEEDVSTPFNVKAMLLHSSGSAGTRRLLTDELTISGEKEEEEEDGGGGSGPAAPSLSDFSEGDDASEMTNADDSRNNSEDLKEEEEESDLCANACYSKRDEAGAPIPLEPEMVTLSMLPRTQWLSLVHLDVIKARNKPLEAPKKPAAAPFFLPTLTGANAGRDPVFDTVGGAAGGITNDNAVDAKMIAAAAGAWGNEANDSDDDDDDDTAALSGGTASGEQQQQVVIRSRVLSGREGMPALQAKSNIVSLLRGCSDAGDWTSLVAYLRQLPPSSVDLELRSMQILADEEEEEEGQSSLEEEERDLELLFRFLEAEAASNSNFEFVQALLRAVLLVHGDAIMKRPAVKEAAERLYARLEATWTRVSDTLHHVRCMVGLLGSLQT